jgi:two-component system sensor histidine kinase YesM
MKKHKFKSLRLIFSFIFTISIILPVTITNYIVPSYYKQQLVKETDRLVANNLESIAANILVYLSDLQKLAVFPYFDKKVMQALMIGKNASAAGSSREKDYIINEVLPIYINMLRKEILSYIIINNNGSVLYFNRNQNVKLKADYDFRKQTWYQRAILENGNAVYIGSHQPDYFNYSANLRVFSLAKLIRHPYMKKTPGVIFVDADTQIFKDMFGELQFSPGSIALLLDADESVIYASKPVAADLLEQVRKNLTFIKGEASNYNVIYKKVVSANWKIAVLVSDKEIRNKIRLVYIVAAIASLITLFVTYFFFQMLTLRYIIMPIKEMSQVMKEVEGGNLEVRLKPRGSNEIVTLGGNLNNMIAKLNELITRDYKLVISQKKAKYQALVAQIQPHFLYNTLNGFLGLNRLGKRKLLEESIINLTEMLRYTLAPEEYFQSSIENEFEFIKKYCNLQKLRFAEKMETDIKYDEAVKKIKIPKLLVQPLVENAVKYCVQNSTQKCTILVHAERKFVNEQAFLVIRVQDNGMGFDPNNVAGKGIGISNVKERLTMSYHESSFEIVSKNNVGTTITIGIPIAEAEEERE